jgi:hypothetical protein
VRGACLIDKVVRFSDAPKLARLLMFKGGTSLSKVYALIERFSEDGGVDHRSGGLRIPFPRLAPVIKY